MYCFCSCFSLSAGLSLVLLARCLRGLFTNSDEVWCDGVHCRVVEGAESGVRSGRSWVGVTGVEDHWEADVLRLLPQCLRNVIDRFLCTLVGFCGMTRAELVLRIQRIVGDQVTGVESNQDTPKITN